MAFAGAAAASSFAKESASEGLREDTGKAVSLLEQLTQVPPYDPHAFQYDMQTYGGRCLHFFSVIGDLSTLTTTQAQVERYRQQLSQAEAEDSPTDAELWRARQVLMAVVHPQTGEVIPAVLRFSFFAPANLVICAGLLSPGASLARTAFFQWLNQTYNVAVNYANRSSGDVSPATLGAAYCAATSSSLAIALGLQAAARRLSGSGSGGLLRLTVPALAVSVGGVINLLMTRGHELRGGVAVHAADGTPLGESVAAARLALLECSVARVVWTVGLLTLTPVLAAPAAARVRGPTAAMGVELAVSFGLIWAIVPCAMALFPQRAAVQLSALEPHLGGAGWDRNSLVYYNKGL